MKYDLEIFHFHGNNEKLETQAGFKHKEYFRDYSMSMILVIQKQIFENGLNTMLLHTDNPNKIVLMVDDKRFRQR